jgi:hypothetical protein
MKANKIMALKKVIKELVEKEVAKQINIVVEEMRSPAPISEADAAEHYTGTEPPYRPEPLGSKEYTQLAKDPVLNRILNETQGGISDTPVSMPGMAQEVTGVPTTANQNIQVPDFMQKAMSGHSAKVVKEIESKHGTKS